MSKVKRRKEEINKKEDRKNNIYSMVSVHPTIIQDMHA